LADTDVIGFYQNESKACFTVLHFSNGNLLDKDFEVLSCADEPTTVLGSLIAQYYQGHGYAPRFILLPFDLEDSQLLEQYLSQKLDRRCAFHVPQKGDKLKLIALANANAKEEVLRATSREERSKAVLNLLGKMLKLPAPNRIEAFDISNISGTDIVAGMVVFVDGKPKKSEYKKFAIKDMPEQDDYASMQQAVTRRFTHYKNGDKGFDSVPDLLLVDGGVAHAQIAADVLARLDISVPVFGMVKDDNHHTRALVTPYGQEISIAVQQSVFAFIGTIQEEVHRFAIEYHRLLRSETVASELDKIPGVGEKRKAQLLKAFKTIKAIKQAEEQELAKVVPSNTAKAVYEYFH
jgi:excinuclease ABC subunit C